MLQLQNGLFHLKLLVLTVCFAAPRRDRCAFVLRRRDLYATAMFVYDSVAISPCVNISRNTGEVLANHANIQLDSYRIWHITLAVENAVGSLPKNNLAD